MKVFPLKKYLPVAAIAIGTILFSTPVFSDTPVSLMDMMDQFDKLDKQDFQSAIDKANACTRARNFPCSVSELAKAEKAANSGQDKKTLLAGQKNLANEKQQLANEIRRAEEERQAQVRREEEREQARVRREEEREARLEMEERQAKEAEDRQSLRDYSAAIGAQIRQRGAENAALLNKIDRQTNAAIRESNRVQAAQTAERDRARTEREDREADRRRDAERERTARADAERSARVRASDLQPELPKYQPQVVTVPSGRQVCPPGSSPARQPNGEYVTTPPAAYCIQDSQSTAANGSSARQAANNRNPASDDRLAANTTKGEQSDPSSVSTTKKEKKIEWGAIQLEAIAICHQNSKSGKWECNGALDNQMIVDEPTLESALARQYCSRGTWAAGGPTIQGVQWDAYRCGHALGVSDYDVAKKHGLITARRTYICPKYSGDGRCTTIYDGQDKR